MQPKTPGDQYERSEFLLYKNQVLREAGDMGKVTSPRMQPAIPLPVLRFWGKTPCHTPVSWHFTGILFCVDIAQTQPLLLHIHLGVNSVPNTSSILAEILVLAGAAITGGAIR